MSDWLTPEERAFLEAETERVRARLFQSTTDFITVNGEPWLMLLLKDRDMWQREAERREPSQ